MRVATAVQAALRERGIEVAIKAVSNAQLFLPRSGVLAGGLFDLAYVPWTMGADPDDSAVLGCGGASNYMRWCDPQVERLERAALATPDVAARKRIYAQDRADRGARGAGALPLQRRVRLRVPRPSAGFRAERLPADVERVPVEADAVIGANARRRMSATLPRAAR